MKHELSRIGSLVMFNKYTTFCYIVVLIKSLLKKQFLFFLFINLLFVKKEKDRIYGIEIARGNNTESRKRIFLLGINMLLAFILMNCLEATTEKNYI